MLISVHPHILGVSKYLICDSESGSYSWSSKNPDGAWVFGDPTAIKSLDVILQLCDVTLPDVTSKSHMRAFRALMGEDMPKLPWHKVLPAYYFQEMIQTLVHSLTQALESFVKCAYGETFIAERAFLLGLSRASIDTAKLSKYLELEDNPTVSKTLSTFQPTSSEMTDRVVYNQVATITGRLTVKTGPMILTLPKKYKDLIKSRYEGGEIIQLDFVSLEPRVARFVAGYTPVADVYSSLSKELFQGLLSREQAKLAVLCALYGASARRLQNMLGNELNSVSVIRDVKKYFGVLKLVSDLTRSIKDNGCIKNMFGRKLVPDRMDENVLVNHYIQSSATDIALLGFRNIVDELNSTSANIKSLFVIHDALILDVAPSSSSVVRDIASRGVTIEDVGAFPLNLEVIRAPGA
jgi:hypothetical protein